VSWGLLLRYVLLFTSAFQEESSDSGTEQGKSGWFWNVGRSGCHLKRNAVVPEVTIRIKTESYVAAVCKVSAQYLQLGGCEIVRVSYRSRRETA